MKHKHCPLTGKVRFPTQGAALRAARNMEQRHKGLPSVYHCPECDAWHLTHYSYRDCHDFTRPPAPIKHHKKMDIYIYNDNKTGSIKVDIPNPDEATQLGLTIIEASKGSHSILFNYRQALDLAEAIKIQMARMKRE